MLYERWRQVAKEFRGETALTDLSRGERWSFTQLAAEFEKSSTEGPIAYPQGSQFIFGVLRAWRAGQVVCPLETEQTPPDFVSLPPGCVHLKTTSATAGPPRMVAFTAEQLVADAENIMATMGLRRDWPNLGAISLAHSYGFSNLVLPLLLHGIPLIMLESPLPEGLRRGATSAENVTLAAVPALWRAWHEASAIPDNVRLAICAGAPLQVALEQAVFASRGLKLHNFYGASECGGIAFDATTTPRTDGAYAGAPMKNVELSADENGCLVVRSRAVGETYWPESMPWLGNGCFRTNDLGEIVDGNVFLRGRAGDQINVAGRKLSPETIERVLVSHPAVRECLVFGAPSADAGRAETIVACVAANGSLDAETLRHFLLEKLPSWQMPREWMFVDSLRASRRGKLSRAEWRQKYLADRESANGSRK